MLFALLLLIGVVLLIAGLRGRLVGDDSICRNCRYDLRGRPTGSTICPECGADLAKPKAIQRGRRNRRPGLAVTGVALALGALLYSPVATSISQINWIQYKPLGWILNDADSTTPATRDAGLAELLRRMKGNELSHRQTNRIVEHVLAVHGDTTRQWSPDWGLLLDAAARAHRLTDEHFERFLKQSVELYLDIKPRIRRGGTSRFSYHLRINRTSGVAKPQADTAISVGRFRGTIKLSDISFTDRNLDLWGNIDGSYRTLIGFYGGSAQINDRFSHLPDGSHTLTMEVEFEFNPPPPFPQNTIKFTKALAQPIELLPAGSLVDDFVVDDKLRQAMRDSVRDVIVEEIDGRQHISIRLDKPPVPLAVDVVLMRDDREQIVGQIPQWPHFPANTTHLYDYWHVLEGKDNPVFSDGVIDVLLRPSQDAADKVTEPRTYWGEEIRVEQVTIGPRPDLPHLAVDESFRQQMRDAIKIDNFTVNPGSPNMLAMTVYAHQAPFPLRHELYLQAGSAMTKSKDYVGLPAHGYVGHGIKIPIPASNPKTVDIILRPTTRPFSRRADEPLPWGEEIIFRDIPIP